MSVKLYKDLNQFTPTSRPYSELERAVYQALYNILTTRPGELLFDPNFGVELEDELFELNDEQTRSRILSTLTSAIEEYEPRVVLDKNLSQVETDADNYKIKVSIVFSIIGIEDRKYEIIETFER